MNCGIERRVGKWNGRVRPDKLTVMSIGSRLRNAQGIVKMTSAH
jgi:hypothetical protein